jgi:hypothetical protein
MVTSFSGGRSLSTRREPLTMGKQLVNFITCSCYTEAKCGTTDERTMSKDLLSPMSSDGGIKIVLAIKYLKGMVQEILN